MNEVMITNNKTLKASPVQITFNRLKKKIESLNNLHTKREKELEEALQFYHVNIFPLEQELKQALIKRCHIVYEFRKAKNKFSNSEKENLRSLILDDLQLIFESSNPNEVPPDLQQMFQELSGTSYQEMISESFEQIKDDIEKMFDHIGIDINLKDANATDNEEELITKLFQSAQKRESRSFKKTKKQLEKEQKQQKIEELQKKSANVIYRQLAKIFHPDLESNLDKKKEKEELMQKLTTAYANSDLYTLLLLEMEWLESSNQEKSREQLQLYNAMLKEQTENLQDKIDILFMHPKYAKLQTFYPDEFTNIALLKKAQQEIKTDLKEVKEVIQDLQRPNGHQIMKNWLIQKTIIQSFEL